MYVCMCIYIHIYIYICVYTQGGLVGSACGCDAHKSYRSWSREVTLVMSLGNKPIGVSTCSVCIYIYTHL